MVKTTAGKTAIFILWTAALAGGSGWAQEPGGHNPSEPKESPEVLTDMVVEAENQVRQTIEKSEFLFEPVTVDVDSLYSAMDLEVLKVSPVSGLQPHLNNLVKLSSDQPPHLWLPDMATAPVATFFPSVPEGHELRSWSLTVTDYRGNPFKTFSGGRETPETLTWDGRSDQGTMLMVGYPYSYVFSQTDKGTNTYNHAGDSFRVPAVDYSRDGDRVLEMAGGEIFFRQESRLTHSGNSWLTRSTDEIRRHPWSPVKVVVTAETMELAEARAELVAAFLADSLVLPRNQLETAAVRKPDLRSEMDGSVAVVIGHAN
jgi:hypothetical protein